MLLRTLLKNNGPNNLSYSTVSAFACFFYKIKEMFSLRGGVAVCQMTSTAEKDYNFSVCSRMIKKAKDNQALMVFLPECCDYIAKTKEETLALAEPLDGPLVQNYKDLAQETHMWLSLGGIHERVNENKVYNSHIIINPKGDIVNVYRKVHLFDAVLPEKFSESSYVEKGCSIVAPILTPVGWVGMAICYDLRFPEIGLALSEQGTDILTYPSAFTYTTGSQHWEVLLRCRAIENQCYVIAAAQVGEHNENRRSWGHAMVIDPLGNVRAECGPDDDVLTAQIEFDLIRKVRSDIPVWAHKRYDLYPKLSSLSIQRTTTGQIFYQFGQTKVKSEHVFYKTDLSIGFVNIRCVVPGHVLIIPIRPVKRLGELHSTEVTDLFLSVQKVQRVMESVHNTSSSSIVIQDGPHAGQTIWHIHVHILPRKGGDFKDNDDVYRVLEKHDKTNSVSRTEEEMRNEAEFLRTFF